MLTVGDLLGQDWPFRYRILHPAYSADGERVRARTWSEVANDRGSAPDLARAAWHDVSGVRLHSSKDGPDTEPIVGPTAEVLVPVLHTLTTRFGSAEVRVAEWTGYAGSPHFLPGAIRADDLRIGRETYAVWQTAAADLLDAARGTAATRPLGPDGLLADHVWDAAGQWLAVADGDLASTYCGTRAEVAWPAELEWVAVDAGAPLG
jgi:hypothetical protein